MSIIGPIQLSFSAGLLIDCFKTIEFFRFRSQNHCLIFFDSFFQKNLNSIAFAIVGEKGVILRNRTAQFRPKNDLFPKPGTTVKDSNKE